MQVTELKGRMIEDVPFSGLVERLCQIALTCETVGQAKDHLDKDDLMSIISTIMIAATEGLTFSTATRDEIATVQKYLISGMTVDRSAPH